MNRLLLPGWWRRDRPQWSESARTRIGIPALVNDFDLWQRQMEDTEQTR